MIQIKIITADPCLSEALCRQRSVTITTNYIKKIAVLWFLRIKTCTENLELIPQKLWIFFKCAFFGGHFFDFKTTKEMTTKS